MISEHAAAVALAQAGAEALRRLFLAMGSASAPDGAIWRAHRVARAALGSRFTARQLADALSVLEAAVAAGALPLLERAAGAGAALAGEQLALAGLRVPAVDVAALARPARDALLAELAAAHTQIQARYALAPDPALVVGDGARVGALSPALAATELARWITTTHQAAFAQAVDAAPGVGGYRRQAVATLSARTTRCCLSVHGQIVGLDEPFALAATPRFADRVLAPPFHHYCRTVVALVRPAAESDALTAQMRAGARAELAARARGGTTQVSRSGTALTP